MPSDASRLNSLVKAVKLPTVICNYIESIGRVTLANGASVVPHIANTLQELLDYDRFLDDKPLALARRFRRDGVVAYNTHANMAPEVLAALQAQPQNEARGLGFYDPLEAHLVNEAVTEWRVIPSIVHMYNENTRADKIGLTFRTINNEILEGKAEMLSCFQLMNNLTVRPTCCETISESAALLGSAYMFRSDDPQTWLSCPGNYLLSGNTCVGPCIENVNDYLVNIIRDSLRS
jgi:hypothetical protein